MKRWTKQREALRQRIRMAAEQMDLPDGMLAGQPQLTLDGDMQLLVERHRGIEEYGDQHIRIAAKGFTIEIVGQQMYLVALNKDCVRIRGRILGVRYQYQE